MGSRVVSRNQSWYKFSLAGKPLCLPSQSQWHGSATNHCRQRPPERAKKSQCPPQGTGSGVCSGPRGWEGSIGPGPSFCLVLSQKDSVSCTMGISFSMLRVWVFFCGGEGTKEKVPWPLWKGLRMGVPKRCWGGQPPRLEGQIISRLRPPSLGAPTGAPSPGTELGPPRLP